MNYITRTQFFRFILLVAIVCSSVYVVRIVADGTATNFARAVGQDPEGASVFVMGEIAYATPSVAIGGGLTLLNPIVGIAAGSLIEIGSHFSDAAHDPTTGERRDIPEQSKIWLWCVGIIVTLFAYVIGQALGMHAKTGTPTAKRLSFFGAAFVLALLASTLLSAKWPMMLGAIAAASCYKSAKVERQSEAVTGHT